MLQAIVANSDPAGGLSSAVVERMHRGAEIRTAFGHHSARLQRAHSRNFSGPGLENGAARRRRSPRKMVGDFQRPGIELPRRTGERLEPECCRVHRRLHVRASLDPRGPGPVLPDGYRQPFDRSIAAIGQRLWRSAGDYLGRRPILYGVRSAVRPYLAGRPLGPRPQYGAGQYQRRAGQCRRSGKRSAHRAGPGRD